MKVIFLGKDKPETIECLRYLIEKGIEVSYVVGKENADDIPIDWSLIEAAKEYRLPRGSIDELYRIIHEENVKNKAGPLKDIVFVISYLFWERIKPELIYLPSEGCINFHPAPLPEYRGLGGYNIAILENLPYWGVSVHYVDEEIDTGDIIEVVRFEINPMEETAWSLERRSQKLLLNLFKKTIDRICGGEKLERLPQGEGRYISKRNYESLKMINPEDTDETIERKIRAFWFPPYNGATIILGGKKYTIINQKILDEVASLYKTSNQTSFSQFLGINNRIV